MRWRGLVVLASACRINFDATGDAGESAMGEVEVIVEGRGAVMVSGAEPCVDRCTYPAPAMLAAQPAPGWRLESISSPCSTTEAMCTAAAGSSITVSFGVAPITANRMFVTSTTVSAAIGIAGLDAACVSAAANGGLTGTFIAFASTSTVAARARLAGGRGWVRLDGLPLFDTVADLGVDSLPRAVLYTELGTPVADIVMTGSTITGAAGQHCTNWTNTGGYSSGTSANAGTFMFSTGSGPCQPRRIYCAEADRVSAVSLVPEPLPVGRIAFVTRQDIASSGGVATADAVCASEASAAGLPGSYRAWVATTTESANARIGDVRGIWKRPDGIVISWERLDASILDAAINIDAMGGARSSGAWFGAASPDVAGAAQSTCNDWTTPSNALTTSTYSVLTNLPFSSNVQGTCAQTHPVVCAQLP